MRPSPLQTQARAARFAARGWRVLTASALLVGLLACRSVHEPADTAAPAPAPADGGIWVASALRGPVEALADARRRAAPALPPLQVGEGTALRQRVAAGARPDALIEGRVAALAPVLADAAVGPAPGWSAPQPFAHDPVCLLHGERLVVAPATVLGALLQPGVRIAAPLAPAGAAPGSALAAEAVQAVYRFADGLQPGVGATLAARTRALDTPAAPEAAARAAAAVIARQQADAVLTLCSTASAALAHAPGAQRVVLPPSLESGVDYVVSLRPGAVPAASGFAQWLRQSAAQALLRQQGLMPR